MFQFHNGQRFVGAFGLFQSYSVCKGSTHRIGHTPDPLTANELCPGLLLLILLFLTI